MASARSRRVNNQARCASRWRAGPRRTAAAPAHTGSPDGRGACFTPTGRASTTGPAVRTRWSQPSQSSSSSSSRAISSLNAASSRAACSAVVALTGRGWSAIAIAVRFSRNRSSRRSRAHESAQCARIARSADLRAIGGTGRRKTTTAVAPGFKIAPRLVWMGWAANAIVDRVARETVDRRTTVTAPRTPSIACIAERGIAARFARAIESAQRAHSGGAH